MQNATAYHVTTTTGRVRAVVFDEPVPPKERKTEAERLLGEPVKSMSKAVIGATMTYSQTKGPSFV